jgi:5-methylcytosine-specific restriction endonuclease McrA
MKYCAKCDSTKPLGEFHNNRSNKDGKTAYCKPCWKAYSREQHVKHRTRRNATVAKWYQRNRERKAETTAAWREANRDRLLAVQAQYRADHRDELAVKRVTWAAENAHLVRASVLRGIAKRKGATVYTITLRDLIRLLTSPCAVPGCTRTDIELDHVIPLSRGGSHGIGNLQSLCQHHNRTKHSKTWIEFRAYLSKRNAA